VGHNEPSQQSVPGANRLSVKLRRWPELIVYVGEVKKMAEIRWAQRVEHYKIRQLYVNNAKCILDNDLLQDVGISFYVRAESVIAANRIHEKNIVECPACHKDIIMSDENQYICECGWNISSKELHLTYKGKQLIGPSIVEFAEKFIRDWNIAAGDANKQMMAIDFLIHRFHWEMTKCPTRPVAVNYIKGKASQIINLISELAFTDDITGRENHEHWLKNKKLSDEIWKHYE
jgi:hypothetical protein